MAWSTLLCFLWNRIHLNESKQVTTLNTLTKYDIYYSDRYGDNPDNKHHHIYQRVVNRRFAFTLSVFILTWTVVLYGWQPALAIVFGALIGLGILTVAVSLFPVVLELIHDFCDWIDGY